MSIDPKTRRTRACVAATLVLAAGSLAGCRGDRESSSPRRFFPDMDRQPKWQPQDETEFFADGRTQRLPVDNTVAFGRWALDPATQGSEDWAASFMRERSGMLAHDDAFYTGSPDGNTGEDGQFIDYIPMTVTRELIERGRDRFNIYCASCHGYTGDGNGPVGVRWSALPANLLGEAYTDRAQRTAKDGYLYDIVRNGKWGPDGANRMPGYKHALDATDAWAVVAYVRALQVSQNQHVDDMPEDVQQRLLANRPAPAPAPSEEQSEDQPESQPDGPSQAQPGAQPAGGES